MKRLLPPFQFLSTKSLLPFGKKKKSLVYCIFPLYQLRGEEREGPVCCLSFDQHQLIKARAHFVKRKLFSPSSSSSSQSPFFAYLCLVRGLSQSLQCSSFLLSQIFSRFPAIFFLFFFLLGSANVWRHIELAITKLKINFGYFVSYQETIFCREWTTDWLPPPPPPMSKKRREAQRKEKKKKKRRKKEEEEDSILTKTMRRNWKCTKMELVSRLHLQAMNLPCLLHHLHHLLHRLLNDAEMNHHLLRIPLLFKWPNIINCSVLTSFRVSNTLPYWDKVYPTVSRPFFTPPPPPSSGKWLLSKTLSVLPNIKWNEKGN